jgi:anti-sigma B factor antagonist
MEVTFEHPGKLLLINASGRLDTASAPSFDAQLEPLLTQPHPNIMLDLTAVSYMCSAGLRSISQLMRHAKEHGGRLGLVGTPPNIMEVIKISGFRSLLDFYPDRASALNQGTS